MLDVISGEKREIGYDGAGFPAYLPDFESILFYRRSAATYVSAVRLGSSEETNGFPSPIIQTSGSERNPSYSPQRNKLAYYSNSSGFNEIWIADTDGANREQLTSLATSAIDPVWSPDGTQIAFVALDAATEESVLMICNLSDRSLQRVSTGFGDYGTPSWANDGHSLIVPIVRGLEIDLWRIETDGNNLSRLTAVGAKFGRESPDGQYLYYTKSTGQGLFRMPVNGGDESIVVRDNVASGIGNWTWAGPESLLYSRVRDETSEIVKLDLDSRDTTVVLRHPSRTVHRSGMLAYSEQHQTLFFTHREPQQIDILRAPDPMSEDAATH